MSNNEYFSEKDKSVKKEKSEQEGKKELLHFLQFRRWKELLRMHIYAKEKLDFLKAAIKDKKITVSDVRAIVENTEELPDSEIAKIFSCIDEIENIVDIDTFLPQDFRVSKSEYQQALSDPEKRSQTVAKLTHTLAYIATSIAPNSGTPSSIFISLFARLDKNLILIQEHTIDIRRSLQ
jgi:hypothetical protein